MARLAADRGMTLVELMVTTVVLAIAAVVMAPSLAFNRAGKLSVAAEKVGNGLRLARSEAMRSGQNVLVDAETAPGRLRLFYRSCTAGAGPAPVNDRLTRQPYDVDVTEGNLSSGVVVAPRFLVAGTPWPGLVFAPSGAAVQACSVAAQIARGVPEVGSSVNLSFDGQLVSIAIDPATGRISGF